MPLSAQVLSELDIVVPLQLLISMFSDGVNSVKELANQRKARVVDLSGNAGVRRVRTWWLVGGAPPPHWGNWGMEVEVRKRAVTSRDPPGSRMISLFPDPRSKMASKITLTHQQEVRRSCVYTLYLSSINDAHKAIGGSGLLP